MDDEFDSLYGNASPGRDIYGKPMPQPGSPFQKDLGQGRSGSLFPDRSKSNGSGAVIFVVIGIILIFLGTIFGSLIWVIDQPDEDDYDDWDDYRKAVDTYEKVMRWFTFINDILTTGGALVLSGGMMGVALMKKEIHPNVKVGLLIGAALILGFMLSRGSGLLGLLTLLD
ncbi:MAG: hypothetical protein ACMUHM_07745 [Thermoplasmatota archaeon]